MKEIKNFIHMILLGITILIVIWWLGMALRWQQWEDDQQRAICVKNGMPYYYCLKVW